MKKLDFKELEDFSVRIAHSAGAILLSERPNASIVTTKAHSLDFATTGDIASEKYLRREINQKFPSHGILGEEEGTTNSDSDYTWVLDPLDGTLDYKRGLTSFNVHIALEYKGVLIVGCIYRPMTAELFTASKGLGVKKNGISAKTSKIESLKESIVRIKLPRATTSPADLDVSITIIRLLAQDTGLLREGWEDGVALGDVAAGSIEGFIVPRVGPKWWDVAAGILMVEEAGGKVTDMVGNKIKNRDLSKGIVASNGKIHEELLKIINGV